MINIKSDIKLIYECFDIKNDYSILHYDEYPILFCGKNQFNVNIIASLADIDEEDEDEDEEIFTYFYSQVSSQVLYQFLNQKITYLALLKEVERICVVDKDWQGGILNAGISTFDDIPTEYLPLEDAYCPPVKKSFGLDFSISLKGDLARKHQAKNEIVTKVSNGFVKLIDEGIQSIGLRTMKAHYLQKAHTASSFKINILVVPESEPQQNLFQNNSEVGNYLANYLSYCTEDLLDEIEGLVTDSGENTDVLNAVLLNQAQNILASNEYNLPRETVAEGLKANLIKSLETINELSSDIGNGFDEIQLIGTGDSNDERIIGIIDKEKQGVFDELVAFKDNVTSDVVQDEDFRDYKILIYNLNVDTCNGSAYIKNIDDDDVLDKAKIKILAKEDISNTKYTNSLHETKWIDVKAKATKRNGKFTKLFIELD